MSLGPKVVESAATDCTMWSGVVWIRRFMAFAQRITERLLHPLRRALAISRLRRGGVPKNVLFLCHGNICRSPYGASAFANLLAPALRSAISIASAGFFGPDRPSPPEAISVARSRGVDLSTHRSTLLSPGTVRAADLILVMDAAQRRTLRRRFSTSRCRVLVLGDLDPEPIRNRTIQDPVDRPADAFESTYARIDRCLGRLVCTFDAP